MYEIASATLGLLFIVLALRLRSPLFILARSILIGATWRTTEESFLEFSLWMASLFFLLIILDRKKIQLNFFSLEPTKKQGIKFVICCIALSTLLFYWWLRLSGIADFSSSKRDLDNALLPLALSILLDACIDYSTAVLAFYDKKIGRFHLMAAAYIQILNCLRGFVLSQRGSILNPLFLIFSVQLIKSKGTSKTFKRISIVLAFITIALLVVSYITQARRQDFSGGLFGGFNLIYSQISSARGNYFSPERDKIILTYVNEFGTLLPVETLFSGFYGLIPRALWQSKPSFVGVGPIVGAFVFGTGDGVLYQGAGIPISFPAQIALTLGEPYFVAGIILVVLLGYVIVSLSRKFPILIFPFLSSFPSIMGSDIGRIQISFVTTAVGLLFILNLVGLKLRYSKSIRANET